MARFVNHSCDPNCEIRQMLVRTGEGKKASVEPRMALFALDERIKFGDELTYDYNFE
jgi:[histone H3]-lysine4 N-trimethyltransferase ASH1L